MVTSLVPHKRLCDIPAGFAPDAMQPTYQVVCYTLLVKETVIPHFRHRLTRYRGICHRFTHSALSHAPAAVIATAFALSLTTPEVSSRRSIRWFAYYA